VLSGDLPESRIDDACRRVLALKEKYGILDGKPTPRCTPEKRKEINAKLREVGRRIAEKGMTLTANHTNLIPVDRNKIRRVKMVYIGYSDLCLENLQCAVEEFAKYGAVCELQNGFCAQDNDTLDEYDLIVYANYIGMHKPTGGEFFFGKECNMLRQIMTVGVEKSVGVSFGNPDIYFNYFTAARSFVNCYSLNKETIKAFVRGLYGDVKFTDHAPFPLNPITCTDEVY
jgi:beta-N-acetylhexosaminidase